MHYFLKFLIICSAVLSFNAQALVLYTKKMALDIDEDSTCNISEDMPPVLEALNKGKMVIFSSVETIDVCAGLIGTEEIIIVFKHPTTGELSAIRSPLSSFKLAEGI